MKNESKTTEAMRTETNRGDLRLKEHVIPRVASSSVGVFGGFGMPLEVFQEASRDNIIHICI